MLCTVCCNAMEGIWDPSKTRRLGLRPIWKVGDQVLSDVERLTYGLHASKESLEQSQRHGCVVCSSLGDRDVGSLGRFGYFTTFSVEFKDKEDGTEFLMLIDRDEGIEQEEPFAPYSSELFSSNQRASAINIADDLLEGRTQSLHSNLTDSTEDPATWNVVEWWLSNCVATHEACAITSKSSWVPTRLLKLHAANNTFQLVSQNDVEPGSRYAALSHCWGSKSWALHLILNRDNDAALRKQQPVALLPKTFRDAFTIVQRLDLQYLWIDRFCIYQDSTEDWQKEASMMHKVYRNSFVCISALSAADDDGGCFFTRDVEVVKPSILNFSKDGVSQPKLYTSYRNDRRAWKSAFSQEVLTSRAWVVQERLLAPRTLHFGKDQIYWECNQEFRSETQPENEWRRAEAAWYTGFETASELRTTWKALIGEDTLFQTDPTAALGDEWLQILRLYTSCKLSHEGDKLVAISAIVKDMKRHLEGLGKPTDYFAGMWGLWLPQCLLWSVSGGTAQKHRSRQYRAPSWSWASVDLTVVSELSIVWRGHEVQVASVSSVEVRPLTDDDTGQVEDGFLTLKGKPVQVRLEKSTEEWDERNPVAAWRVKGFETVQGDSLDCGVEEGGFTSGGPDIFFDTEEDVSDCVLFFPILFTPDNYAFYRGLLLASSGSDYKRVGSMDIPLDRTLEEMEEYEVRIV